MERKIKIRTDPPGAAVYLDGRRIGETSQDGTLEETFLWYGTRHIVVLRDGYQPVTVAVALRPPLYEIPPLDILAGAIVPWTIVDTHQVSVRLVEGEDEDLDDLLGRAEAYRGAE